MLWMLPQAGRKNSNNINFQLWQQHNHPLEISSNAMAHQKLHYIHFNPVTAGFVAEPEDLLHISAIDYYNGKGLLEIIKLDLLAI